MASGDEFPRLLRSETMSLVQLYIPSELAHATVEELAELKAIQFRDLNSETNAFSRTYVGEIRRLDEMERRLNYLTSKIEGEEIHIRQFVETSYMLEGRSAPQIVDELDPKLAEHEERVAQMQSSYETLAKRMSELEEARQVLRETASFFSSAQNRREREEIRGSFDEPTAPLLEHAMETGMGIDGDQSDVEFVAGTIDRARMGTFERVLWRVLRGNLYMNYAEIDQTIRDVSKPKSEGGEIRKNVFLIFAHGSELLGKIKKIAESMGGTVYPIDPNADKREEALREVSARIEDLQSVLHTTNNTRRSELGKIADSISAWWAVVRKEKIVYNSMNMFKYDSGRRTLMAEGWVATRDIHSIQLALRNASDASGATIPPILHELHTTETPPTFIRTNKFTEGFQSIVDAYGIANYQEVNPGLFTLITFPFLFAVMFGDIGHGTLMMLAALALILSEKRFPRGTGNEIGDTFFHGRYIVFLMGCFAIYTGFIYNDVFSLSLNFGGSGWDWPTDEGSATAVSNGRVYPFGLDPAWHGADNNLVFTNSLKMKMSIILGVIHMSFAICLQVPNLLYFKQRKFVLVEWLPQIIFMEAIFGYLVIIILVKWMTKWDETGLQPPNLLNLLIYMFLSPGSVQDDTKIYSGQGFVQAVLLLIALCCVPVMLAGKPYLLYREAKEHKEQGYEHVGGRTSEDDMEQAHINGVAADEMEQEGHGEGFELGEVMIHQVIHTIEFCLGAISNTASYLRLWALSLAHAQLSEVLWTMTMKNVLGMEGPVGMIAMFVIFGFWFVLTVSILVLMEGLSAFLHALRLHWVEANGKHFGGAGEPWRPISFAGIDDGF